MATPQTNGRKSPRTRSASARKPVALNPSGRKRGEGEGNLKGRSGHFLKRRGDSKA